jgi:uncharacterized protein YkwD
MKVSIASLTPVVVIAACDSPGARGGGAAPDASPTEVTDSASPTPAPSAACALWQATRDASKEGPWTGRVDTCDPGDIDRDTRDRTLLRVNAYRELAGLPPVALSDAKNAAAQACSLLMQANRDIVHEVPADWRCYQSLGADAALLSNLATTPAVEAVDLYMVDTGVPTLGHRRWILSNTLGPIGVGSATSFSCLHVIGGEGRAEARYTAWPPAGEVPIGLFRLNGWLDLDEAGWSIQSDRIDPAAGEIEVTRDGERVEVEVWSLASGYGSTYGVGLRPKGFRVEVGRTYRVVVDGPFETIDHSFTPVDCP